MDVEALTRALVDIESVTDNEEQIGDFLYMHLLTLTSVYGGKAEKIEVAPRRFNVLASWGEPAVTLSTHMDTVPPWFAAREDETHIWGRGACDTKGIIASMIKAVESLLSEGVRKIGLLFVVGEERNSAGAFAAARDPRGCRFLINGEPTENKLALGSKGCLRYEIIARGRMAHSAYPELGESAVNKLLDALGKLRAVPLPVDRILGPSTMNIGTLTAGRAPNVIPDFARAEVMIRLVDNGDSTDEAVRQAVGDLAEVNEVLRVPAVHLGSIEGFETSIVAYTTDIPAFGTAWGRPYLLGPGTIHVAHTSEERISKADLHTAVGMYQQVVRKLLSA